jgi:hypothetical protein
MGAMAAEENSGSATALDHRNAQSVDIPAPTGKRDGRWNLQSRKRTGSCDDNCPSSVCEILSSCAEDPCGFLRLRRVWDVAPTRQSCSSFGCAVAPVLAAGKAPRQPTPCARDAWPRRARWAVIGYEPPEASTTAAGRIRTGARVRRAPQLVAQQTRRSLATRPRAALAVRHRDPCGGWHGGGMAPPRTGCCRPRNAGLARDDMADEVPGDEERAA